jgi:uncharacterized protein (TIGR02594 family)
MRSVIIATALLGLGFGSAQAQTLNHFESGATNERSTAGQQSYRQRDARRGDARGTRYGQRRMAATTSDRPLGAIRGGRGGGALLANAQRHIGGNPTGRRSLWCGHFINHTLKQAGHRPAAGNTALGFANYGRASGPQPGAIAVMRRKGGGHVGIVQSVHADHVVLVSGNSRGGKVAVARYPKSRIIAYRMPG